MRVDAPALAPLTVERHLALEHTNGRVVDNRDNPKYACLCVWFVQKYAAKVCKIRFIASKKTQVNTVLSFFKDAVEAKCLRI